MSHRPTRREVLGTAAAAWGVSRLLLAAPSSTSSTTMSTDTNALKLWYRQPAGKWVEALPIGNGRLGGMVFGGIREERLQLNEDTLWAGGPYDPANPEALAALKEVRKLIFARDYAEAQKLIDAKMMAKPVKQMMYLPAADLLLHFSDEGNPYDYRRELDLDAALAAVTYKCNGVGYTRQVFASAPDNLIVVHLSADKPAGIRFNASLKSTLPDCATQSQGDTLVFTGRGIEAHGITGKLKYEVRLRVLQSGGKLLSAGGGIAVSNADSAVLLIASATSYKGYDDVSADPSAIAASHIAAAGNRDIDMLRGRHIADYQK